MKTKELELEMNCYREYIDKNFNPDELTIEEIREFMELYKLSEVYYISLDKT